MHPATEAVRKPAISTRTSTKTRTSTSAGTGTSTRTSTTAGLYLSPTASFYLLASITLAFLAGSSAPTPLYPVYQSLWGLSPVMITVVFGVYALAVLAGLLFAGRLSDHVGRRPVLMAATLAQAMTMLLFATAASAAGLVLARIIQGLITGAALSAVGAAMIDLNKSRGTAANAVAPAFGSAAGGIVAGFFVQFLPAPMHLIYAALAAVFVTQAVGLKFMKEPIAPIPGAWKSLRPQIALPSAAREPLLLALPVLIAVWALGGLYASLGPMLVRGMLDSSAPLLGGLALFVLAASGGIAVLLLQSLEARKTMALGAASLLAGTGLAVLALTRSEVALFFLATAIAGVGFGTGFQGAVRTVVSVAAPHERAGTLSIVFIVSYIALGVPAIIAGSTVRHTGLLATAQVFGFVVMALAAAALIAGVFTSSYRAQAPAAARRY
jgi:predicted MFS family arabinose efflux permease